MSKKLDRRQFLGSAAMAGAATAAAVADSQAATGDAKVIVGVMGLSRGAALAQDFARLTGVEVKYVCDVDAQRASSCAQRVESVAGRGPKVVEDFRRILDDKAVDALVCAAPNHWHAPATILACSAGKHVYVEKPCCHHPREGERMIQAARQHRRAVQMGTQRRSGTGTIEAIQHLHDGAIGRVYLARCWYNNARPSIGRRTPTNAPSHLNYELWQGPAPRRPYLDNVVHYNWHWRWNWGNGELGNNGVHTIDLCRWGLGVDYPTGVSSSGGRYHFDDDQETPDTHTVCFDFEGGKSISWQGLSCNRHGEGFVAFYGDKGALDLQSNGNYTIVDAGNKPIKQRTNSSLGEQEHKQDFLAAIRNDTPERLNAEIEEGHKSTLLCHLGNIAHRVGRSLRCDPQNGHIMDDAQAMSYWSRDYHRDWDI